MITLRRQQLAALAAARHKQFIDDMCAHVTAHFGAQVEHLAPAALRVRVVTALAEAESFGLRSRRDQCRYLGLAVVEGWEVLSQGWICELLGATSALGASERLSRVIDERLFRLEAEENDRRLEAEFGIAANEEPSSDEDAALAVSKVPSSLGPGGGGQV
jgi:hypothetical protein